jgi:glycogen debranching enzyme
VQQEKSILIAIESELLTPQGIRSLAPGDPAYQGIFGCGFAHADQYHRDLSYHNGMAWPWLIGAYCDAIINVFGAIPETAGRVGLVLQPLLAHLVDEACLGSISEIFDGNRPHLPRGAYAHALAVAETARWLNWQLRH